MELTEAVVLLIFLLAISLGLNSAFIIIWIFNKFEHIESTDNMCENKEKIINQYSTTQSSNIVDEQTIKFKLENKIRLTTEDELLYACAMDVPIPNECIGLPSSSKDGFYITHSI